MKLQDPEDRSADPALSTPSDKRGGKFIFVIPRGFFLRSALYPCLIAIYVLLVFICAWATPSGLHWPHSSAQKYRAAHRLPENTRLRDIDVKRPTSKFTSQFWNTTDFDSELKGLYTTRDTAAGEEIDPLTLARTPKLDPHKTVAVSLTGNPELQSLLNAGSTIILCNKTATCTSKAMTVSAVLCETAQQPKCYVAVEMLPGSKDYSIVEQEGFKVVPVTF